MKLQRYVLLSYSNKVSLFVIIILNNFDTFVTLCYSCTNVEHTKTVHKDLRVTISTSWLLLIAKERSRFVTCHFFQISFSSHVPRLTCNIEIMDVSLTIFKLPAQFFSEKLAFHYAIIKHLFQLAMNFFWGKMFKACKRWAMYV